MKAGAGDAPGSIAELLARTVERLGDQPAVVDGDTRLTYSELDERSRRFGAALVEGGVAVGDRVAIWAPNSVEWIVAVLGLWRIGAVLVPINTRFKGREAAEILRRSGATALVTVTDFLDTDLVDLVRNSGVELPELRATIVISGPVPDGAVGWDEFVAGESESALAESALTESALAESALAEVDRRGAALSADDRSDILFTSGTTGVPKGVVQTHGRTLCVALDWVEMTGLRGGDRYLMVNPYFHMFGLKAGILAAIAAGATMYPEAVFDVDRVLDRVESDAITVLPGAPTIYQSILDHSSVGSRDLSSLRVAVTGAADIPVELIRRMHTELPFEVIVTGYGLTEGGTAVATSPGDDFEVIATTVGRPRPSFELRIVDSDGAELPAGEAGEIVLRGASIMLEYLDDPGATADTLTADGWLSTGDLGALGEDGNLRIMGRSKDMFIVGGFNAYPAEIENSLLRHPAVQQVAVIGIPDERLGEVGMAFVVRAPGVEATEAELVAWSRAEMANYKAPRRFAFVDELPINATGKVVKEQLRQQAAASAPSD